MTRVPVPGVEPGWDKDRYSLRHALAKLFRHSRKKDMIVSDLQAKDLLRDRLRPVAERMKGAGEIFVDLVDGQAEMDGTDEDQSDREEQQVIVEGTEMQMGIAMAPDKSEQLADEAAVRAVPGLDEKVGRGPALFRRALCRSDYGKRTP